jgi:hypothetical protein
MKIILTALVLLLALTGGLANADDNTLAQEANAALAQKDYKTAFTKFSILAEQGKPAAQFNLGAFYLNGQGVQKDDKLAFEWFRKSAAQGNARALQIIESASARGNVNAKNELTILQGSTEPVNDLPQPQAPPLVKQEKPQEKPVAKAKANRAAENTLVYNDPTVAAPGKWVYGISADYSKYKSIEPLYYPVSGVLNNTTQSYNTSQPGISAWVGYDDISVMASFGSRSGNVASIVQGVGALNKAFHTKESEIDVRWLIHQLSTSHFSPFVLVGYALDSTSGTENEISFEDVYSQKDSMLMLGAGAIIPVDEKIGFRVDGRMGSDRQTSYGKYIAGPGVTLNFNAYRYTATAPFSRLTATMYYKISGGWNAQLGARHGSYSAGVGPAFSDTGIFASIGYTYR